MVVISSVILIGTTLVLTIPHSIGSSCDEVAHPEVTCNDQDNTTAAWVPPLFNADLIYGWAMDPRHFVPADAVSPLNTFCQVVFVMMSLGSLVLSILTLNDRNQLDAYSVLFSQGVGTLLYAFFGECLFPFPVVVVLCSVRKQIIELSLFSSCCLQMPASGNPWSIQT